MENEKFSNAFHFAMKDYRDSFFDFHTSGSCISKKQTKKILLVLKTVFKEKSLIQIQEEIKMSD